MLSIRTQTTFQFSSDSWLQISPNGKITYRLNPKFLSKWNSSIKSIGIGAAQIAASYTPFSFFRSAWKPYFTYDSRGIIDSITINNQFSKSYIYYRSQYADSGKVFKFSVLGAIDMLEHGRKPYKISSKSDHGYLTPGIDAKGRVIFTKKDIKVARDTRFRTEPVTNALKFMKREAQSFFSSIKAATITTADYKPNVENYRGNFKGGTSKSSILKQAIKPKGIKGKQMSKRYKNFRSGVI